MVETDDSQNKYQPAMVNRQSLNVIADRVVVNLHLRQIILFVL